MFIQYTVKHTYVESPGTVELPGTNSWNSLLL